MELELKKIYDLTKYTKPTYILGISGSYTSSYPDKEFVSVHKDLLNNILERLENLEEYTKVLHKTQINTLTKTID